MVETFYLIPDDDFDAMVRQIKEGHGVDVPPQLCNKKPRRWTEEATTRLRWMVRYPYLMTQMLLFEDRFDATGEMGSTHILVRHFRTCDMQFTEKYSNHWIGKELFAAEFRLNFIIAYNRGDIKYAQQTLDTTDPG